MMGEHSVKNKYEVILRYYQDELLEDFCVEYNGPCEEVHLCEIEANNASAALTEFFCSKEMDGKIKYKRGTYFPDEDVAFSWIGGRRDADGFEWTNHIMVKRLNNCRMG